MAASHPAFRSGQTALLRAIAHPAPALPACPDLAAHSQQGTAAALAWLRQAWESEHVADALAHASPHLATQVRALCRAEAPAARDVRRAAFSLARYLLRLQHRPTPFGLFAGVAATAFGPTTHATWGSDHDVTVRPAAEWIAAVIDRLEECTELLPRLPVVLSTTLTRRGDQLIAPYQPHTRGESTRPVEAAMDLTGRLTTVLATAGSPLTFADLADKLAAEFPTAAPATIRGFLQTLIRHGVLLTGLHAPSTEPDALAHLLQQLDEVDADTLTPTAATVDELRAVHTDSAACVTAADRDRLAARMHALVPGLRRHPLALDLALDAHVVLPDTVAREIERAADVLARLTPHPTGTSAWRTWHERFFERYGIGTLVPLQEVLADSGLGYPDGYPGTPAEARRPALTARDDVLLRLAQTAALEDRDEVALTDAHLAELATDPDLARMPPHLELAARVLATDTEELQRGRFHLEVAGVSRGAGVTTGRFLSVLPAAAREQLAAELADLPAADADTVPAQLSFPPLIAETAHVTRTPQILPTLISLHEHRTPGSSVLTPADLAVGCDGRRLYLAAPQRGHRVEAVVLHALNRTTHTPPLARFLTELSRAPYTPVGTFDWGAAAAMPFLPRLRYGRIVLSPARWRLTASELPGRQRPRSEWDTALAAWQTRRRLPRRVQLAEGDRRLLLDLDQPGHRALLRQHLHRNAVAVLTEAADPKQLGWCGGRAHEVVVPLTAARTPAWPSPPQPVPGRVLTADQVQAPGAAPLLLAALYGNPRRQDLLLTRYLPDLLERLGRPQWWFLRYRDPRPHLRLRLALPGPDSFAATAAEVSAWASELRAAGLLADLRYPTSYREIGRWGSGPAWDAAEDVFRADSRALHVLLAQPRRPARRALVTAHFLALAAAFHGSPADGTRWLVDHLPPTAPHPVPRGEFTDAVRIADPTGNWAALREQAGGEAVVTAWAERDAALAAYRRHLPGPHTQGITADDALTSLLHLHFVRHVGIDRDEERICLYLARAAALAHTARTERSTR